MKNNLVKMIIKIWMLSISVLTVLCLFMQLCIFVTELDIKNIEKETEYQKLKYFQTLNKVWNQGE